MAGDTPHPTLLSRRQVMAAATAAGLVLTESGAFAQTTTTTAAGPATQAATQAKGIVFDDADASGQRKPGSAGVADVMVSNGREVVKTDASGAWTLPVRPGQSVFVIKPAGWMTPVDPVTQLPRFAYLHEPDGTPEALGFRFHGVTPTGPLPDSIDFPLRRQAEAAQFDAILFTDPQPESLAELGYVRDDVVARSAGTRAAFGITHGDLMFDDLSYYDRFNRIVGTIGLPWYNCCGNHDMNFEAPDNAQSRETFKRVFGARYHAFQYGGATFFVLDNVDYHGTNPAKPNGFGGYRGFFGEEQLAFVRNVLAQVSRDSLVVYSFHIPLRTLSGTESNVATVDGRAFLEAISSHSNSVSFCGHTHTNEHYYFGDAEGFTGGTHHHHVLSAVSGSWWSGPFDTRGIPVALASDGTPNGHHILSVDGARYTTQLIPAHDTEQGTMRVMLDSQMHGHDREMLREYPAGALLTGPISRAAAGATRLVVNLYDGGPRSEVKFAIGRSGEPVAMQRVERLDPLVQEVYVRHADVKKPWVNPDISSHIWQAPLPPDLAVGTHRIIVQASDEYGRTHESSMVLEVTG